MIRAVFQHELRLLMLRPVGIAAVVTALLAATYALWTGGQHLQSGVARAAGYQETVNNSHARWLETLRQIEGGELAPSPYDARPINIRLPAALAPAPLGDFARGAYDLHPTTATIGAWSNAVNLFPHYQFDNPGLIQLGRFDFAFVAIVLLPLLMIALSFDAAASDRASGRLRLLSAQPIRPGRLVLGRLLLRAALLWVCLVLVALVFLLVNAAPVGFGERLARFGLFAVGLSVYALFWFALISLCVAYIKRSEAVIASLIAAWAILTLGIPGIVATTAERLYPQPSRLAYLSEMRQAQGDAAREAAQLTAGFLVDHPDLTVSDEAVPDYYRGTYLANLEVERRTGPVLEAFVDARTQRDRLIGITQYASPAIITSGILNAAAGADIGRHYNFQQQARFALRDLSGQVGPAIVARQRMTTGEVEAIPNFGFEDQPVSAMLAESVMPFAYLFLLALAGVAVAWRRFDAPLEVFL
ncbi:MAG: DUF3526 domain-containing protein [Pseudomonadota bacterium]